MSTQPQCGLFSKHGAVPLSGVHVAARLRGACTEVTVTQRFCNREAFPIEAVYVFPLDESAAVCGFAALVSGRVVRGKAIEREQAFATYDDAMQAGDGAFLLDQERPNVFTASVGNLRPGEIAELQIRYVALLPREGDAVRLSVPTTVSPRYVPAPKAEIGQPDGERVNPERWPVVPYGLSLSVDVGGHSIRRIESPSHPIRTTLRDHGISVELAQEEVALDRDFVLLVESSEAHQPAARVAREADGTQVLMLTFLPKDLGESTHGNEVLFLLDCSGSMGGDSITQAKRALALCVRALGSADTFNVVCFGSTYRTLFPRARRFDERTLDEATQYVASIEADLGGTEILAPLTDILEQPRDPERARRVLVLTDGQVSNEAEVIALATKYAGDARIFAFGIGAGASEYLVRGIARASRGACEMIFPGERIEPKVLRTFARVRTPVLDDVRVDFGDVSVQQAPRRTPPVFAGDVLSVFARVERGRADAVELVAGTQRFRVPLDLEHAETDGPIPTLWARARIRELEEGAHGGSAQHHPENDERRRARIVELAVRYGLMSSETSFVAVEERTPNEQTREQPELRRIPVALTQGWGARDSGSRITGAPMAMAMAAPATMHKTRALGGIGHASAASAAPGAAPASKQAGGGFFARAKRALLGDSPVQAPSAAHSPSQTSSESGTANDRVFDLLMTQRADGSFSTSPTLVAWLGSERMRKVREACELHDEPIVVTSIVLLVLEREEADRESEWRPAVSKAKTWLAKQPAQFDARSVL